LEHISTENPPTPTVLHEPTPGNHCLQQENNRKKKLLKKNKKNPINNLHQLKHQEDQKLQQPKGLETKITIGCLKG
jgi:hypothetical protein